MVAPASSQIRRPTFAKRIFEGLRIFKKKQKGDWSMKWRSFFAAVSLAAAVSTLAAPCVFAQDPILNVGMAGSDLSTLDPHRSAANQEKVLMSWMFNGLVRLKPGSINLDAIEPDLATEWTSSPDKKVWTFQLRRGVKFHGDFGELSAEDVVFSLKRAADPKQSTFSADFANIEDVKAIDPFKVEITLKRPSADLLYSLIDFQGGYIVSKKAVETFGADFGRKAIGTGPFAFADYKASRSVTLKAHEGYFRGRPKIGQIVYRYLRSDASRDLAYTSGEIDLTYGRQDQRWAERMQALNDTVLDIIEPAFHGAAHLNLTHKPLDDLRVRQAIAHAIDNRQMVSHIGPLISVLPKTIFPAATLGADTDAALPAYDPEKAKALLKEAGFGNGLKLKIITSQNPANIGPTQILQAQLAKVGIDIDLIVVEHSTYHQQIRQDLSDIVHYNVARLPVADRYLNEFYHSRSAVGTSTAASNFSHCSAGDEDIDAAARELDQSKQILLWKAAQKKIIAALCAVPLFEQKVVWARRKTLDYGYELRGSLSYGPLINENTTLNK
jgi:peptide/nickel transport system substrate-binding protein